MELLESDDPKRRLLKKSASQKAALEDEVNLLSARTEKIVINALVIGGALAISYILVRQLGKKQKKKKVTKSLAVTALPEQEEEESQTSSKFVDALTGIGTMMASQATAFLLALAKEKLMEYLEKELPEKKVDEHP